MMMKKVLAVLALLLSVPQVVLAATPAPTEVQTLPLCADFDLDSTSYTYCNSPGRNTGVMAGWIKAPLRVTTSGSSATVTSYTASSGALASPGAGDFFRVVIDGVPVDRYIVTNADDNTVTLNSAIDISSTTAFPTGATYWWRDVTTGTTATSGWVITEGVAQANFTVQLDQANVTGGIDLRVECQDAAPSATSVYVFPATNYTSFPSTVRVVIDEPWYRCRVGFKIGSADDGGDLTTNAEKITVTYVGVR
jgi:hypothetical protein